MLEVLFAEGQPGWLEKIEKVRKKTSRKHSDTTKKWTNSKHFTAPSFFSNGNRPKLTNTSVKHFLPQLKRCLTSNRLLKRKCRRMARKAIAKDQTKLRDKMRTPVSQANELIIRDFSIPLCNPFRSLLFANKGSGFPWTVPLICRSRNTSLWFPPNRSQKSTDRRDR